MRWLTVNALKSAFLPFDERLQLINRVIKPGFAMLGADGVARSGGPSASTRDPAPGPTRPSPRPPPRSGAAIARRGLAVVYGGGAVGLMGVVADAALAAGGEVVGIIPRALEEREIGHRG